jgi:hypothetical protein
LFTSTKVAPCFQIAGGRALVADAGLLGDVLELEVAEVAEKPAALGLAHDKDVGPAVAVVVADRHARCRSIRSSNS